MLLKEFLRQMTKDELQSFAGRCQTTRGQLQQVALGNRRAGEALAINIERESLGVIRCEALRPDVDWGYLRNSRDSTAAA